MFAASGASVTRFNAEHTVKTKAEIAEHEARVSRVAVLTVQQTGMPSTLTFDDSSEWLREYCLRNNATYYARPRESFSVREACEQAVRENRSKVIVEDLS
jgi:hypothetical protein